MATDLGTDVAAASDWPDPEELVAGEDNVAYALARRLLQPAGVMEEIGETETYDCIDVRDWLATRTSGTGSQELSDLEAQATQVLLSDPRVASVTASATFDAGRLSLLVEGAGAEGPFKFILSVDQLSAAALQVL
jgi:hypothetical protein